MSSGFKLGNKEIIQVEKNQPEQMIETEVSGSMLVLDVLPPEPPKYYHPVLFRSY